MDFDIPYSIQGIPCILKVWYEEGAPEIVEGSPDKWQPYEPPEIGFWVYDRKGYRAKWLENKIDDREQQEIREDIIEVVRNA